MLPVVLGIAFFWGIGQNLPYQQIYLFGIGPGDLLFLGYLPFALVVPSIREPFLAMVTRLRHYFCLVSLLVGLTLLSSAVNAYTWGIEGNDIFEIFRPFYYFLIVVFVAQWTTRFGMSSLLIPFLCGVLVSGVTAYVNPAWEDYAGSNVLWNPNVVGNMLAIGMVLSSLLILNGRLLAGTFFTIPLLVLSVFTFSKGTWLMCLLGLAACIVAAGGTNEQRVTLIGKWAFATGMVGLVTIGIQNFELINELIVLKLQATQLGDTAVQGGSAAARFGFVIASLYITLENPLIGVGISNFEQAYNSLRDILGDYFWETDNPHSAWLYVMACIGLPALAVFVLIVAYPLRRLWSHVSLRIVAKRTYFLCVVMIFVLSGAFLLHLLTQYFLWFFTGIVIGWRNNASSRPRQNLESVHAA